jgi:hypothetical protein
MKHPPRSVECFPIVQTVQHTRVLNRSKESSVSAIRLIMEATLLVLTGAKSAIEQVIGGEIGEDAVRADSSPESGAAELCPGCLARGSLADQAVGAGVVFGSFQVDWI